jgi:glycosyltransferase involved in cell wall biosynthesis
MKIAFYAPLKSPDHPVASGERTVARALMVALQRAGHQVELACRFRSFDAGNQQRQIELRRLGGLLAQRLASRFDNPERRPDVWFTYHLYHKAPDWIGPFVAQRLEIPYVVAEASFAPKQANGRWQLGHLAVAEALGRADLLFTLNPADTPCVLPLLPTPDRLVYLPPFTDCRPVSERGDRKLPFAACNADLGVPWLVTAAMMRNDQKLISYRVLAAALERLSDRRWCLFVAGAGPAQSEVLEAFAALKERVYWTGLLMEDELRRLYSACDLYVWPAVKEAWSMALLEAQAAGLPVVAGRSGGIESIVADGETGLLVPAGDVAALADAVSRLLERPYLRQEMGAAAGTRAARFHDAAAASAALDRHLRVVAAAPMTNRPTR